MALQPADVTQEATDLVSALLGERYDADAHSQSEDPWRKGGFKKMKFKAKDFIGKRPGDKTRKEKGKEKEPAKKSDKGPRWSWEP